MSEDNPSADEINSNPSPQAPPVGFWPTLQQLGPGLIIAGSIVGSGELIATTKTGAQAGISLLWLIILGCIVKVFAQIELGRFTITHSETTLTALNRVPGKLGPMNWIVWFWVAMMLAGVAQLGGIVGGVGQATAIAFPLTGDYVEAISMPSNNEFKKYIAWEKLKKDDWKKIESLPELERERIQNGYRLLHERIEALGKRGATALDAVRAGNSLTDPYTLDDRYWATFFTIITAIVLFNGRYSLIQNVTTVLVVAFTFITIGNTVALQNTVEWNISNADIMRGLSFGLPQSGDLWAAVGTALATFGIIGVGSAELVAYPYWCLEKGYAKFTGKRDNTDEWASRAKGWIRVMQFDAYLSMVVYTVATIAFFLVGVAVLYREGRDPDGMRMVSTLATAYIPMFGTYARWLFLVGAIVVLYSTFLVANAGQTRMFTDLFKVLGFMPKNNERLYHQSVSILGIVMPFLCLTIYWLGVNPVHAVLLAGIMQGLMLPMIGLATLMFRYRMTDERLKPGPVWDILLISSTIAFTIVAGWTLYSKSSDLMAAFGL